MSGVNFLSFGKREKLLKRTHKKYLFCILVSLLVIALLIKNIFLINSKYENMNSIQVYKSLNTYSDNKKDYLDKINFLMNEMKIFTEKILYKDSGLSIEIRILDKKNIYDIVDRLKKNLFNITSYSCISEDDNIFVYSIEVGI